MPLYEQRRDKRGQFAQRNARARKAPLELTNRPTGSDSSTTNHPLAVTWVYELRTPRWSGASLRLRSGKPARPGPVRGKRCTTAIQPAIGDCTPPRATAGQQSAPAFPRATADQAPNTAGGPSW